MINYSKFVKAWNHAQKLAGVRQRSSHCLRHSWASYQIAAGDDTESPSFALHFSAKPTTRTGENDFLITTLIEILRVNRIGL
jgi:integrase